MTSLERIIALLLEDPELVVQVGKERRCSQLPGSRCKTLSAPLISAHLFLSPLISSYLLFSSSPLCLFPLQGIVDCVFSERPPSNNHVGLQAKAAVFLTSTCKRAKHALAQLPDAEAKNKNSARSTDTH